MVNDGRIRRRLKLRDFDTFLAVSQHGSMAKAAAALSVSQPAVSKAIADMEYTLGIQLFDRTAKGVEPSLYGRALHKWAVAVFDDVRQGVNEIEFLADPTAGELRVGGTEPIAAGFLPAVITKMLQRHPRLRFQVRQTPAIATYTELRQRRVDLIVGRLLGNASNDFEVQMETLFDDPMFPVAGLKHPLARRQKVKPGELAEAEWAFPLPENGVTSLITRLFLANGIELPKPAVECNSFQLYGALLEEGRHLAVYPRSLLHFSGKQSGLKVLPVQLRRQPMPVGIITLRNRVISPVAQLFIECARELARPLAKMKPNAAP
jgi:DNA-binding transcriptional LysR family regulator